MRTHKLKTVNPWFTDVYTGIKRFEFRLNDRSFAVGDRLRLCEYDVPTDTYSGAVITAKIVYVLDHKQFDNLPVDWVILGITIIEKVLK